MNMNQTRILSPLSAVWLVFGMSVAHAEKPGAKAQQKAAELKKKDTAKKTETCRRDVQRLAKRNNLIWNKAKKDAQRLLSKACIKAKFKKRGALKLAYKSGVFIKTNTKRTDTSTADESSTQDPKSAARSNCIRAVIDLAKRNDLILKDGEQTSPHSVRDACNRAKFKSKLAFKMVQRAGGFMSASKATESNAPQATQTADKKGYLKTCQREIRTHSNAKQLRPKLRGTALKTSIEDSCRRNKFDGYLALKALFKSGVFVKVEDGKANQGKQAKTGQKGLSAVSSGKKKKSKSGTKSKTSNTLDPNKLKTCVKKVKYRVKSDKLYPRNGLRSLDLEIQKACTKAKLNTRKSFGLVKRHLTKRRPSSTAGNSPSKTKKKTPAGQTKTGSVRSGTAQDGASNKSLSKCKTQVWAIAEEEGLRPLKGKSNVNKHILEQCRLNAYVAKTVFKRVRTLFTSSDATGKSSGSNSLLPEVGPSLKRIGQSNQLAFPTGDTAQRDSSKKSKACRVTVAKIIKAKGDKTVIKLTKKEFNRRITAACRKTNNDPKAAASILLKSGQ
ncbi:MAG: hypothetical protein CMH52_01525 [Myxococcales bacterium]|nr:hypothetical protein [Myxococcales bacterium]